MTFTIIALAVVLLVAGFIAGLVLAGTAPRHLPDRFPGFARVARVRGPVT